MSGRGATAALSYVSLFGDAISLICGLVGSPLFPAFLCSLLPRRHRCRLRCSSRRWGRSGSCWSGRGATAASVSYVSLFGDAIGLVCGLVGSPLFPAFPCSLLPRRRRCRLRCSSRRWERSGSGWSGRGATAALSYVSLECNAVGLIGGLIGAPFFLTCLYSPLLGHGVQKTTPQVPEAPRIWQTRFAVSFDSSLGSWLSALPGPECKASAPS